MKVSARSEPRGGLAKLLSGPAGIAAAATLLTVMMAAPVFVEPAERLFGSEIVGRHPAPFISAAQFEQPPRSGIYSQPATDAVGVGLARVFGSGIAAYNALVLASFVLAAVFAFLLARELSGSLTASWIAGLAYAFAPYHVAQAAYHVHGAQVQWLPLYFFALWRCCGRAGPGRIALLIAAAALVTLSSFYYGLMAVVMTPVAFLGYWLLVARKSEAPLGRSLAATAGVLGALAGAGLAFVLIRAPAVLESPSALAFPRDDVLLYSARWWSYLLPPVEHPLFGSWSQRVWELQGVGGLLEQQVTIGFGLLLLAAAALAAAVAAWRRGGSTAGLTAVPLLLLVGAVALLFSLPPEWSFGSLSMRGPSGVLHGLLPMFRAYARFGVLVLLALAILAGVGAAAALRGSARARAAAGLLLMVAAVELAPFPPWRWRDVLPTSAHRWLKEQTFPMRVLDCVGRGDLGGTGVVRLFGKDLSLLGPNADCGQPGIAGVLAAGAYSHMLVRRPTALGRWMESLPEPPGLEPVGGFDDALLYEVRTPPPPVFMRFGSGFHWREHKGPETYRWMGERGELLVTQSDQPAEARSLVLVLSAFPDTRIVDVLLDGRPVAEIEVGTAISPYRLGPLELTLGDRVLTLESRAGATVADDILQNGDPRALSIAVWNWHWIP